MAVFVDLEEESEPPQTNSGYYHLDGSGKPDWNEWQGDLPAHEQPTAPSAEVLPATVSNPNGAPTSGVDPAQPARENPNQTAMTEALGCYP